MPLRDPGDKLYRMGNGFSKMLQMINFDNNGNVSLSPNLINEQTINSNDSRIPSAFPAQMNENNTINNNYNTSKQQLKKRIKSANPKIKIKESKFNSNHQIQKEINAENSKTKNEVFPDINEANPKITKIYRKTSSKH